MQTENRKSSNRALQPVRPVVGQALLAASNAEERGGAIAAVPHLRRAALEALREGYLVQVEALAEKLRPRFESGELVPWDSDDDRWEDLPCHPARLHGRHAPPQYRLETLCRRELARTFQDAYLVLAASPSESEVDGAIQLAAARDAAAECIWRDVLQVATRRGWCRRAAEAA